MKISAFFNSIDEAEIAVRAIRERGIPIKRQSQSNVDSRDTQEQVYIPIYPESNTQGLNDKFGMYGTNSYGYNQGALYIAALDIGRQEYREDVSQEVQLVLDVNESNADKVTDILVNRHGMNVRRF